MNPARGITTAGDIIVTDIIRLAATITHLAATTIDIIKQAQAPPEYKRTNGPLIFYQIA